MSHAAILVAVDCKRQEIDEAISFQMEPFDENDTAFKDGSRWDWYVIGGRYEGRLLGKNILKRSEFNREKMKESAVARYQKAWDEAKKEFKEKSKKAGEAAAWQWLGLAYEIGPDTKEAEYVGLAEVSFYGFLRNRTWHENERLGWFGGSAKTECEIATGEEIKGKCLHKNEELDAKIVVWNSPEKDWTTNFYRRFIEPLPPETYLVVVDYHV